MVQMVMEEWLTVSEWLSPRDLPISLPIQSSFLPSLDCRPGTTRGMFVVGAVVKRRVSVWRRILLMCIVKFWKSDIVSKIAETSGEIGIYKVLAYPGNRREIYLVEACFMGIRRLQS
jgi:hypothetical protein